MPEPPALAADAPLADATPADGALHECPDCGRFQHVPRIGPRQVARCRRCGAVLRRGTADPLRPATALLFACLALMLITTFDTMMTVSTAGMFHDADLLSGPIELYDRGLWPLTLAVAFTTLIAPFAYLLGTLYVVLMLQTARPPRHLAHVFKATRALEPWSMIDIFLLGSFVAYTKLQDLVKIEVGPALLTLVALAFLLAWLKVVLYPGAIWDAIDERGATPRPPPEASPAAMLASCHACGLVQPLATGGHAHCRRCDAPLHHRKPASISRTWALCFAAAILYLPANIYPVLSVVSNGSGAPSTILGGVEELIAARMWPLAILVFTASIAFPMIKLLGLSTMLVCTQLGRTWWLRERTVLYRIVLLVGRWSMVDIFMESLLGALVKFGTLATIEPGGGALAFCAVVILTMIGAEMFDPRLMWDVAEARAPSEVGVVAMASAAR